MLRKVLIDYRLVYKTGKSIPFFIINTFLLCPVLDEREYQKRLNGPYDVYDYPYRLDELQE